MNKNISSNMLVFSPSDTGYHWFSVEFGNSSVLFSIQAVLGGYIELVPMPVELSNRHIECYSRIDAKLADLPLAFYLFDKVNGEDTLIDSLHGNVVFIKTDGADSVCELAQDDIDCIHYYVENFIHLAKNF